MTVETQLQAPAQRQAAEPAAHVDPRAFWSWVWASVYPVIGWLLVVLGAIVILLAWWGVSRNAIVAKQLPYLASGGIGGVALVALGGRFMMIRDLRQDSGRLDRLERMVVELHDVLLRQAEASGVATAHTRTASASGAAAVEEAYFALPHGGRYHRAGCRVLEGKTEAKRVTAAQLAQRHLTACPLCEPGAAGSSR